LDRGDVHLASADAEKVLANTRRYFTSGGALVRIVDRPGRGVSIERINEQTAKVVLSEMIDWERKGRDGLWVRCDPPPASSRRCCSAKTDSICKS
jgi:hypothetical protein